MLHYADYIDSASNLYEVPRPPRRGSHRPEAPTFTPERWVSVPPPSLNRARSPPSPSPSPSFDRASVTPLTSDFSLLGKRPPIVMTASSPSLAKETTKFVGMNRNSTATRGSSAVRSVHEPDQSSCGHVAHQFSHSARGRGGDRSDGYKYNCLSEETSRHSRVKQESLPLRRSFEGAVKSESIRGATCTSASPPSSTLVELVDQLNARKGGRFSPSILENYAKTIPLSASCQTVQKRCMYPDCTKISVSRGLCRGHGGGRRCHFLGCAKSAQSRSNFCWAHGGGQRCDVPNCMRSRKTKRFCVAHIQFENLAAFEQTKQDRSATNAAGGSAPKRYYEHGSAGREGKQPCSTQQQDPIQLSSKQQQAPVAMPRRYLPSLGQALSSASRSPPNLPGNFGLYDDAWTRVD